MPRRDNFTEICLQEDSCALTGAAAFFAGVPEAAIVVNGPLWCYYYAMRHLEANLPLISQRMTCSQLDNTSIVFGAEDYLRETLEPLAEKPPALLCIENNCSASLIGDDVGGIAAELGIECPVVVFDSGGLAGGFAAGYTRASLKVAEILPWERRERKKARINLLGLTTGYYNGVNDRRELVRLLELAGYEVGACPGDGATLEELLMVPEAELNLVVHEELGLPLAQWLEERFGTPFTAPLPPYGVAGTRRWLEEVNAALPAPRLAEALAEADRVRDTLLLRIGELKIIWGELWFEAAVIAGPRSTALGLAEALRCEWADVGRLTVISQQEQQRELPGYIDEFLTSAADGLRLKEVLQGLQSGLLLGSSNESSLLQHSPGAALQFQPVAYPVFERLLLTDLPFMGLRGARYLQERLWNERMAAGVRNGRR